MKNIFYLIVVLFIGISCKKEGCIDSTASNYDADAKKDDGSCIYPDPYDARDKYAGSYNVIDSTFLGGPFYEVKSYALSITLDPIYSDRLFFDNLFDGTDPYYFTIDTNDGSFILPSQQVSGPYYIEGTGTFTGNNLSMETSGDVYVNLIEGSK